MKYMLIVAALGFAVAGCDDSSCVYAVDGSYAGHVRKMEFEGHTYLIRDRGYAGGICHDENCSCRKHVEK